MRIKLPTFRVPPIAVRAFGWLLGLGRLAKHSEVKDVLKNAVEETIDDAVADYQERETPNDDA